MKPNMNNLNSLLIGGNLTGEPETTAIGENAQACRFSIATNRYRKDAEGKSVQSVTFVDVEAWDVLGANCAEHLSKGSRVRIVGQLRQSTWTDAEGRNRSRLFVRAEHVEFIPRRKTAPDIDDENVPF